MEDLEGRLDIIIKTIHSMKRPQRKIYEVSTLRRKEKQY